MCDHVFSAKQIATEVALDPLDGAYATFQRLNHQIAALADTLVTEADVRAKVIDPIFTDVLGWRGSEFLAENATSGGFVDYVFTIDGRSRLIVEAKKDGRSLDVDARDTGRGHILSGPTFRSEAAKEGIEQAIRYCGSKNAELACVTNGRQWIVFRGNRLGDGTDTMRGMGFAFSTLDSVSDNFKLFYHLLSRDDVERHEYRAYFQEVEGQPIRRSTFAKSLRERGSANLLTMSALASDLDRVMTAFFDRLTGDDDPDLLSDCFVTTAESDAADARLARISEDIIQRVRSIDTGDPEVLLQLIQRAAQTKRHEFVVIVGTKGAGKTTFITRFFARVLPRNLAGQCTSCRINMADSTGDSSTIIDWLDQHLLESLEEAIYGDDPPAFEELEGMFFDEYRRLSRGPWNRLYETDKIQFQIKFGEAIEDKRQNRPNEYINGLVRHVVSSRKKIPVIIFDNADHFDIAFQEKVYQYARSIYENAVCLIILPITDRTSWQLSKHGALQSFDHEALFLPTPPTEEIIRKRIDFLQNRAQDTDRLRPEDRYFVKRGISLSVKDLTAFTQSLQRVFLETDNVSRWIGALANSDVRRSLRLARQFVTSGHLAVEDLLKAYLAGEAGMVARHKAMNAILRANYDIYPVEQHEFVQNLFGMIDSESSPLTGLSILQLLEDTPLEEGIGRLISVNQIIHYSEGLNFDGRAVYSWLDALLKAGLCYDYDPTVTDVTNANRIEITSAGEQHLHWARTDFEYLSTMADVTPLREREVFESMRSAISYQGGGWREKTREFVDYLLDEDALYSVIPEHAAYEGQRRLRDQLRRASSELTRLMERTPSNSRGYGR